MLSKILGIVLPSAIRSTSPKNVVTDRSMRQSISGGMKVVRLFHRLLVSRTTFFLPISCLPHACMDLVVEGHPDKRLSWKRTPGDRTELRFPSENRVVLLYQQAPADDSALSRTASASHSQLHHVTLPVDYRYGFANLQNTSNAETESRVADAGQPQPPPQHGRSAGIGYRCLSCFAVE